MTKKTEMYVRFDFPEGTFPEFKFAMNDIVATDVTNIVKPLLDGKNLKKIGSITANEDGSASFKFEDTLELKFGQPVDLFVPSEEQESAKILLL